MYAGRLVEIAPSAEIFSKPQHPYTIGLLQSIPKGKGTRLIPITGFVPRPEDFPPGCKYAGRCGRAGKECELDEPPVKEVSRGHFVMCYFPGEIRPAR
jgi:oligopeptide/dipeptide ABC transporter ATP-binding protein